MSSKIVEGVKTLGSSFQTMFTTPEVLYVVYFIAFFMATYALFSHLLKKAAPFRENGAKPAIVVALMISIITTGAIFYGKTAAQLLALFNGFGGFLFILILGVVFVGGGVILYNKNKEKNPNLAMVYLALGLYIASALLMPQFFSSTQVDGQTKIAYENTYMSTHLGNSFEVFGDIFSWVNIISLIVLIIYLVKFAFGIKSSNKSESNNREKQKPDQKIKDIADAKKLIHGVINELKEMNNHFNNKINLLNGLRRDIGNLNPELRNNEGKGGNI